MDQRKEEEEGSVLREPTDQREEEESSEEPAGRRSDEPTTDQRKAATEAEAEEERSSDEDESMSASTLFVHPCSLLRYLVRACACCLGMPDSFGGGAAKRSDAAAAPASVDSSTREGEADRDRSVGATEVITRVWAVRRPRPPGNPREGSGGNGGHHH